MALRALLFSSDGTATSEVCHILTDLGIEADICTEVLVAVERIKGGACDALIVDWDHRSDAVFLIKNLRELKSSGFALVLALVHNDADLPAALQAGANSSIRKPIDAHQAHDTLSTARQLMLARHAEQREKQSRLAAAHAALEADEPKSIAHVEEPPAQKTGFLQQSASRNMLEAEELATKPEPAAPPPPPPRPSAPDPAIRARALAILGYGPLKDVQFAETPPPSAEREDPAPAEPSRETQTLDTTHVFSSFLDQPAPIQTERSAPRLRYGILAGVAALLVALGLWAWSPGKSSLSLVKRLHLPRLQSTKNGPPVVATQPEPAPDVDAEQDAGRKPQEEVLPDPEIESAQEDSVSNIQVIESKPIPRPGAQQPPSSAATPDVATPPADPAAVAPPGNGQTVPPTEAPATPQVQPVGATQSQLPQVPTEPVVAEVPAHQARVPHSADDTPVVPATPRVGVIIPDSLRDAPGAAPASALEPPVVSEEISRSFLIKRIDPVYPPQAIAQRIEGLVVLQVWVGKDGGIRDLKLVRGYLVLGHAAVDAVKQWRYRPYTVGGKAIDFRTFITISFKIPG